MSLINYVTQIQFESGAIARLPAECERIGITRPLIVTDRGVRAAGIVDTALNTFGDSTAQLPISTWPKGWGCVPDTVAP